MGLCARHESVLQLRAGRAGTAGARQRDGSHQFRGDRQLRRSSRGVVNVLLRRHTDHDRDRPGPVCIGLPLATVWAAVPTCWALALAGRFDDVHRVAEAGLRAAALAQPGGLPRIGLAEVMALTAVGDYPAAERARERHATGVLEADDAMRGLVHLARGALSSACAAFRDSISAMSGGFTSVRSMPVAGRV